MSGTWAKTLLPATRSARPYRVGDVRPGRGTEEGDLGPDALLARDLGDVGRRLDAEHRHAVGDEVLEKVSVVARYLGHQAVRAEPELAGHLRGVTPGVLDPRRRI